MKYTSSLRRQTETVRQTEIRAGTEWCGGWVTRLLWFGLSFRDEWEDVDIPHRKTDEQCWTHRGHRPFGENTPYQILSHSCHFMKWLISSHKYNNVHINILPWRKPDLYTNSFFEMINNPSPLNMCVEERISTLNTHIFGVWTRSTWLLFCLLPSETLCFHDNHQYAWLSVVCVCLCVYLGGDRGILSSTHRADKSHWVEWNGVCEDDDGGGDEEGVQTKQLNRWSVCCLNLRTL